MKKINLILILSLLLASCEGSRGPQGPPGESGGTLLGTIFEIEADLTAQNDYSFIFEFPPNEIEVFESDIVQVYLLEDVVNDSTGPIDVWTPLPTSFFFENGSQLVYNFNHTFLDVNIFLGGNINFDSVSNDRLLNQVFRIAVIPADFAGKAQDLNSYEAVMQAIPEAKIVKID